MRRPGLVCWTLLLALGLCCARRARPRNVLLILGECTLPRYLLSPPKVATHPSPVSTSTLGLVLPPASPESPSAAPRLLVGGSLEREAVRPRAPRCLRGSAPQCSTPPLRPALTLHPLACSVPQGKSCGPPTRKGWSFPELRGSEIPEGMSQQGQVPKAPEARGVLWVSSPSLTSPVPTLFPNPMPSHKTPSSSRVHETSCFGDQPGCHKATWFFPLLRSGPVPGSLFLINCGFC